MKQAKEEFDNYRGTGMGFLEISHRDVGGEVQNAIEEAGNDLRSLLNIPDNYKVFFNQSGAHGHFAAVPLNLTRDQKVGDYVDTGYWSQRCIGEGGRFCDAKIVASAKDDNYKKIPAVDTWNLSEDSAFVHFCANETIHGLEFHDDPVLPDDKVLVADMTSTFLSRPIDVSRYGVIYASGGKNAGPAGMAVTIVRDDLLDRAADNVPAVMSYKEHTSSTPIHSIYNTPPTYNIYLAGLVYKEYIRNGGMEYYDERRKRLSSRIYDLVDSSDVYMNDVRKEDRSMMNLPFRIRNDEKLEDQFSKGAEEAGLLQLRGHFLFGGIRVTMYNGIPDEGIDRVVKYMEDFEKTVKGQ
jgi:phosphoserine aminotransferase